MSPAAKGGKRSDEGFSAAEKAAMKEAIREHRSRARGAKVDGDTEVREKIATMDPADRVLALRIHDLMRKHAPMLVPRTWYGMPAYSTPEGEILCFFRNAGKFGTRYATFGFSDEAKLDDGHMWPTDFALTELTEVEEAKIVALVKRAMG